MKLYYYPKEAFAQTIYDIDPNKPGPYIILPRDEVLNMLRVNILYMIQRAGSGHIGSAFSVLPIMWDLFAEAKDEDIIFSSKGHDVAAYYAILTMLGKIPFNKIHTFRQLGGLQGHPHPSDGYSPFHTGSLGMGLSKAQGLALADKLAGRSRKIHVIVGDGELQEGQVSEALRNIIKQKLNNRIVIHIDFNAYQCDDQRTICCIPGCESLGIIVHSTEKGYGGEPLHAGALSPEQYEQIVGELIADLPFKPETVEYERRTKPYRANSLMETYKILIGGEIEFNQRVVILNADLAVDCGINGLRHYDRFIEFGISEQDMVSAASGLALGGYLPIAHSFASFLCRRANEQIYNNCCEERKVIYIGAFAGAIPYGPGETHECLEDIALMNTMPNMNVFNPHTMGELTACLYYAIYETGKSSYIRIACLNEVENARL
jgi:transketolase